MRSRIQANNNLFVSTNIVSTDLRTLTELPVFAAMPNVGPLMKLVYSPLKSRRAQQEAEK